MKRIVLWSVLALSLAANLTVAALSVRAQSAASMPMGMPGFERFNPDEEQRAKLESLRRDFFAFRQAHFEQTERLRGRLAELLKNDAPDPAAIDEVLAQLAEAHARLQRRVVEQAISMRAVLRPDQRPAFEEQMTRMLKSGGPFQGGRMGGGMGMGPGMGGGMGMGPGMGGGMRWHGGRGE